MVVPVQPTGEAGPPLTAIAHAVAPPLPLTLKLMVICRYPAGGLPVSVIAGGAIVRAVLVTPGPLPAALTAFTVAVTVAPSANPVSVTPVPVTSWLVAPAVTTYFWIGRPLSSAGCQDTWIAPLASTVTACTFFGAPGTVYGTTVLLTGDGLEPA